ncbi:hypothetical protein C8F01DRAFT_205797 [Mycena amicta]|nr:hypothetical protein C8F01DRAFT_205797 [Mycena amicta]
MSSRNDGDFAQVPPEIVSEIFIRCLPASPSPPSAETAPLLLSQICTLWRDIALDTPDLWSNVVLKDDLKASVDIVRLWSARARTIPMTFVFETQNIELGGEMLVAAMENKERWGEVGLYLPATSYVVLGGVSGASLPHLRNLALRVKWTPFGGGSRAPDLGPIPSLDLSGASQLRKLRLTTFPGTRLLGVRWRQLTALNMAHYGRHLPEDLAILQACKSLVELTVRHGHPELLLPPSSEVVHLPHLESLVVTDASIMKYLFLPLLRRLALPLSRKAVQNLPPLILAWGCTLEALELTSTTPQEILPELFPQLLAAVPSLKRLHLDFTDRRPDYFFPKIVGILNGDSVVPQLETLRITRRFPSEDDEYIYGELRSFLRKKALESKSVRVFKSFTLILPEDTRPSERELVGRELKVICRDEFSADVIIQSNAS